MKLRALVLALSLAACGGHSPPTKSPTASTPTSGSALAIHDLNFFFKDELDMRLHADGRIEILTTHSEGGKSTEKTWEDLGVLHADGTLTVKDGKTGALQADGSFKGPEGQSSFKLTGEELVMADKHFTIDAHGALLLDGKPGDLPLRVEGASDPASRRTALLLIGLLDDSPQAESSPPAAK
jgi:hypothetical protein